MYFIPDTKWVILNHKLSRFLPNQISYMTFGFLSRISTQLTARKLARGVIREFSIDVVHQPIPVSPREPSLLYGLGPPVVMGPMNGNMSYPPGMMRRRNLTIQKLGTSLGRLASGLLNRLMPGKLRAAALLVANERTRAAVPRPARGEIITLAENGVDFGIWSVGQRTPSTDRPVRFIFVGRLVDWKAVDLLLEAFARVQASAPPSLEILGDGSMRAALEEQTRRLGLDDRVHFAGTQPQTECAARLRALDVLVLPSLYECGGAVVLEAMASGLPVIATAWGGPLDYLDESCGILVSPDSPEAFVSGLAQAMSRLAREPELRIALGSAGRKRVERLFDWETKIDQILRIYRRAIDRRAPESGADSANRGQQFNGVRTEPAERDQGPKVGIGS